MTGFVTGARLRAAVGLIAAYAIALQTLFTALAPLPAHAKAADIAGLHILCFGSGNAAQSDNGDPDAPAPASGKFHCVLCGAFAAAAAILPYGVAEPTPQLAVSAFRFVPAPDVAPEHHAVCAGSARAPPLTA